MSRGRETSFVYLTRQPPSSSGVALYAAAFLPVLQGLATTRLVWLPPRASDSQRLSVLVRTWLRTVHASTVAPTCVVVVELAGRGLAEFWTAFLLSFGPRKRRLWVTVHDSPAVTGGAFFFTGLDRRGGRRLAARLSNSLGRRAEKALLQRAERVSCLSSVGARQLGARFELTRTVHCLPHIATATHTPTVDRQSIFLPGYVGGIEDVRPVLSSLADLSVEWQLEVGACTPAVALEVAATAMALGVADRVQVLGYTSESQLDAAFERAAIVVRWKQAGWGDKSWPAGGAVSGPLIQAMAHGCAIITNDTRGISECLPAAEAIQIALGVPGVDVLRASLTTLSADLELRQRLGAAGRSHICSEHDVRAVSDHLTAA